jgi:hypothetical protein
MIDHAATVMCPAVRTCKSICEDITIRLLIEHRRTGSAKQEFQSTHRGEPVGYGFIGASFWILDLEGVYIQEIFTPRLYS